MIPAQDSSIRQRYPQLPKGKADRNELAETIGQDGLHVLTQIYGDSAPAYLRTLPAVDILRQVWVQHYYPENGVLSWREAKNFPPSSVMIASPYDVESRYSEKRGHSWRRYKVHLTETCDDETPHVITHVETTVSTDQDVTAIDTIHQELLAQRLLPEVHFVEGAYTSGEKLVSSQHDYQIELIGPMRQDHSWPAQDEQACETSQLHSDWDREIVTCPMGKHSRPWKPGKGPRGKPTMPVSFSRKDGAECLIRARCTRSKTAARGLTLHPQAQQLALQAAREHQHTEGFQERYKRRAGIEGTVSQAVCAFGMRRTRYLG
jgi:transposase